MIISFCTNKKLLFMQLIGSVANNSGSMARYTNLSVGKLSRRRARPVVALVMLLNVDASIGILFCSRLVL